jgi:single-strand selective monofunctional uracil DNA glycosylase
MGTVDLLIASAARLRAETGALRFGAPVTHVYQPLEYAWEAHETYLRKYGNGLKKIFFLGMNPGPFGMAQTGVPFGEIAAVRDWMGIERPVSKPRDEHRARPVEGFACSRSEVSGKRLWGLFAERFGTPDRFFSTHFVANYCPLVFMEESGRNRTPDKLPVLEQEALFAACDRHLRELIGVQDPEWLVGVGGFAEERLRQCAGGRKVAKLLHPSPASPAANRGWAGAATRQLESQGVWSR